MKGSEEVYFGTLLRTLDRTLNRYSCADTLTRLRTVRQEIGVYEYGKRRNKDPHLTRTLRSLLFFCRASARGSPDLHMTGSWDPYPASRSPQEKRSYKKDGKVGSHARTQRWKRVGEVCSEHF